MEVRSSERLVQDMPNLRCRVNPAAARELVAWITAQRARWEPIARLGTRRIYGKALEVRKGRIGHAHNMLVALDDLARSVHDTVSSVDYYAALREWDAAMESARRGA